MKKFILGIIFVATIAGCQSVDPYTGETKINNKTKYGAGGAAGGAIIGQIAGKDSKSTAIGAAIGTAIGLGYGHYRDSQEAELRQSLESTGVRIQKNGDDLMLIMPGNITFDTNKYEVKSEFYKVLNSIAIVLKKYNKTGITISGHTDSTGDYTYNKTLSQKRANSVAMYLINQRLDAARVSIIGYGPDSPIASNNTAAGKAQNRRVEIKISKMQNEQY